MTLDSASELTPASRRQILSAELDEVLSKLDSSITVMIEDVTEHLFAKAESSGNSRERQELLDAYNNLRNKRDAIESKFKQSFRNLLNDNVSGKKPAAAPSMQDMDWDSLSLVGTDQMDEDVQVRRLSDKIKSSVEWELRDLNARMSFLQGRDGAEESDNPLRPELFCRALGLAIAEVETDHVARIEVMRSFESALSQNVGAVYQDLNARLISRKVLPKVRHVSAPARAHPPRRATPAETARDDADAIAQSANDADVAASGISGTDMARKLNRIDSAVENVVESTLSMFEALQKLVGSTPAYRNIGEQSGATGHSRRNLLSAIQELRDAHAVALDLPSLDAPTTVQIDPGAIPMSAMVMPRMMPNFIWANRDQLSAAAGNNIDRMKIDIVAMLFDQILADEKLPTDVKMLLGRLQLPVLRVALADGTFFATRAHPTRRLIDRLASCAVGYDSAGAGNRSFFDEVERIVLAILRNVDEGSTIYEQLLEEFERFIDQEHAHSNDIVGRAADVLERAEVREVLSINATIQVNQLLYGVNIDPFLRAFLLDVWTHVLVEAAVRAEDSKTDPVVARYKQLCVDLVWSGQAKATPEDRRRLVELLPRMIATLREGLARIGYPAEQEARFFTELMQLHSNAVRTAAGAAAGTAVDAIDVDQFAERLRQMVVEQDINAITVAGAAEVRISDQSARRVEQESQGEVELVQAADVAAPGHTVPGTVRPDDNTVRVWVESLERGNWMELKGEDGFHKVRLAWISPLKSFYLFVGVNTKRAHSLDPDTLRAMLRSGDLRFIEDETLVDRAVRSVMHNLERQTAVAA